MLHDYNRLKEKFSQVGEVVGIEYPVIKVAGLPDAFYFEKVLFENNQVGIVLGLHQSFITVLVLGEIIPKIGDMISKTGENFSIGVSPDLLGSVIDPLGVVLSNFKGDIEYQEFLPIDTPPSGIKERALIRTPFTTGISFVDILFPLGKGQRELIVGNRKVGKTSFLTSLCLGALNCETVGIYCLIGAQKKDVEDVYDHFQKKGIKNILLISAMAGKSQALSYIAPFCALTWAEYFKNKGISTLVILDDMSTHAKYAREIALLTKQFPGRDSYPTDIFYTHARLLERAGNFTVLQKEVSITCLPIAQTKENDLTDYIVSNLIGITDGHLLFDEEEFAKGRRPAINYNLSVTRVGRQVQKFLGAEIGRKSLSFLTGDYAKAKSLSHFGSELSDFVLASLDKGEKLEEFFNQAEAETVPFLVSGVFCGMILADFFSRDSLIKIGFYKRNLEQSFRENPKTQDMLNKIMESKDLPGFLANLLEYKLELLSVCKGEKN